MQSHIIVNETCSTIRYLGRQALKDRWVTASIAVLIFEACLLVPPIFINALFGAGSDITSLVGSQLGTGYEEYLYDVITSTGYTSIFSSIYLLLVTGPFTYGISFFIMNIVRKRSYDYGQIFNGFSYYGKTLGLSLLIGLITFAFMIPGMVIITIGVITGFFLFVFLGLIALVLVIIPTLMFSMAFYILIDDVNVGVVGAMGISRNLMRGNMGKLFVLNLSFIGWLIVAGLIQGVIAGIFSMGDVYIIKALGDFIGQAGFFVVTAYITASEIQFYDLLTGRLRLGGPETLTGGSGYGG